MTQNTLAGHRTWHPTAHRDLQEEEAESTQRPGSVTALGSCSLGPGLENWAADFSPGAGAETREMVDFTGCLDDYSCFKKNTYKITTFSPSPLSELFEKKSRKPISQILFFLAYC